MSHKTSNKVTALLAAGAAVAAMLLASPDAKADPGCQTDLWGFLASQRRTICDGPKRANGEWTRARIVWTPKHYVPITCSGGYYYSTCWGGYWVEQSVSAAEKYPVTDDTVLPDEPGYLGQTGRAI